jgi:DNA-binding LacI/PurR family transcriptional regulator
VAFTLLDFLREEGVAVPAKVSVVGFDDSPVALLLDLTTYNFNFPGIAAAMVHHVLGGVSALHGTKGPVEIEGYVVERQSSRR